MRIDRAWNLEHAVNLILTNENSMFDLHSLIKDLARIQMILNAVSAQALDKTIWFEAQTATEAYLQKSLRDLHKVIKDGDTNAMKSIAFRRPNG